MKALRYSLKSVLGVLAIFTLLLGSCKNHDSPTPDLATQAAGNYNFTEIVFQGQTIPASETSIKGSIQITRKTDSTVDVKLNIRQKATNDEFMVEFVEGVVVSPGSGTIDLFYEGERVAQIKDKKLMVNSVDEAGESFTLVAVK
ncbi:hypothetical protein [Emticicia sp. 17c]|uniref:hypothetical protein n=1 Tax=Emticicia sp. 17c TaxID=3127704 RepID=UPI00301D1724